MSKSASPSIESQLARSKSPNGNDMFLKPAFIIGITGGSASGKTSLAKRILDMLPGNHVEIVSQDCFYRDLTPEEKANAANHNFDAPEAFDWECMYKTVKDLKARKRVYIPTYDYATHSRGTATHEMWNVDVVIFEGILSFHPHEKYDLSPLFDLKIFVETDSDTRLARRVFRDTQHRGRTIQSVLVQYERFVKPAYEKYIDPLRRKADLIIPWGCYSDNRFSDAGEWLTTEYPALTMIVEHIRNRLQAYDSVLNRAVSPAGGPSKETY